jgi:hypothetical protein
MVSLHLLTMQKTQHPMSPQASVSPDEVGGPALESGCFDNSVPSRGKTHLRAAFLWFC